MIYFYLFALPHIKKLDLKRWGIRITICFSDLKNHLLFGSTVWKNNGLQISTVICFRKLNEKTTKFML